MTKLQTKDTNVTITDLLIESFNFAEVEDDAKRKKYSGPQDTATDTGQDNPFWNISLLVRIGGYCATAERSYVKGLARQDDIVKMLEDGKDFMVDAYYQNEASIENAQREMLIFRDFFQDTFGSAWMGLPKYTEMLDEIFSPKALGSSNKSERREKAVTALLASRAKLTGRTLAEQEVFENKVAELLALKIKLPQEICKLRQDKANKILNDSIKSVA
jgi:hypothetical protein